MAFKEIVLLLAIFVLEAEASLSWENCDHLAPIQIRKVHLTSPYPVQIKPNAHISGTGTLYNGGYSTTIKSEFKLQLHIEKKVGIGWFSTFVKVPCVKFYGSCAYKISCRQIPGCPWTTGQQTLAKTFTVPGSFKIPGGSIWRHLLRSGTYKFRADLRNPTNQRVGCVFGKIQVKL